MGSLIEGIKLTPLKVITNELGSVMRAFRSDEDTFAGFGEAYFSTVGHGVIKGWKKHTEMVLNLVVASGKIRFVVYDDRLQSKTRQQYFKIDLSPNDNYQRLTIEPGLWVAFEGIGQGPNILLNIASILHDPAEAINIPVKSGEIKYPDFTE